MKKRNVAIIGCGQTKHSSRRRDVNVAELVSEAVYNALEDAQVNVKDIGAFVVGNMPGFGGVAQPEQWLAESIGAAGKPVIRIAGVIGRTDQALNEAALALQNGFHAVLLSVAAFKEATNEEIIGHCRKIAELIPVIGFYLQPAVGGRKLDVNFWREFAAIENVIAIKIAPFNRYQTFDVVRGIIESGRSEKIALYTGNDDNILVDLLSVYQISDGDTTISKQFSGGLLGHWAVWTHTAVKLLQDVHDGKFDNDIQQTLTLANQITDSNAAFFDTANNFAGCIAGLHEVLRRQGLLEGLWTLNPEEGLSPGQMEEIDRVYSAYPHLNDDAFISENIDRWLSI